jgi:glucose-1-phosphate adenylyltransferase
VPGFGIMVTDKDRRITRFVEKPKDPAVIDSLRIPGEILTQIGHPSTEELFQASMGIYVFNREALISSLEQRSCGLRKKHHPSCD